MWICRPKDSPQEGLLPIIRPLQEDEHTDRGLFIGSPLYIKINECVGGKKSYLEIVQGTMSVCMWGCVRVLYVCVPVLYVCLRACRV